MIIWITYELMSFSFCVIQFPLYWAPTVKMYNNELQCMLIQTLCHSEKANIHLLQLPTVFTLTWNITSSQFRSWNNPWQCRDISADILSPKFSICMYIIVMMSFICKIAHDVGRQLAANSLFPWMAADNTVTNSCLDSRDDQTNLGRSSKAVPK